jgi:hypothetical protein
MSDSSNLITASGMALLSPMSMHSRGPIGEQIRDFARQVEKRWSNLMLGCGQRLMKSQNERNTAT